MNESIERRIAIGVLYSREYLEKIISRMDVSLLVSSEVKTVVRFAFAVYRKTGAVIGDEVGTHFDLHLPDTNEQKEIIFTFITSIDDDEKNINAEVLFYDTVDYLAQRKIEILTTRLQSAIENADIDGARKILENVSIPSGIVTEENPILTEDTVGDIFTSIEPIITFEGKLGRMINKFLIKGSFVSILAPEKRGKSWFLLEFAMRAVKSGLKVAYFEAGDNSLNQIRKRFLMYLLQRPFFYKRDLTLSVFDCEANRANCSLPYRKNFVSPITVDGKVDFVQSYENGYRPCIECAFSNRNFPVTAFPIPADEKHKKPITQKDALEVAKRFDSIVKKYGGDIKLFAFPSHTLTVSHINEILTEQKNVKGWTPDVVVIDYADILATEAGGNDYRHRINDMWLRLRRLSLEWDILLITATQSDAQGHKSHILDQQRFSEDKRKLAHVTAMIGLNQEPEEKRVDLMRINVVVAREDEFDVDEVAHVITGYQIGRAILHVLD